MQGLTYDLFQFVQRQCASRVPSVLARSRQQWLLLVELILYLSDQLLQDVLQSHHAHRAAVFIDDDCEV